MTKEDLRDRFIRTLMVACVMMLAAVMALAVSMLIGAVLSNGWSAVPAVTMFTGAMIMFLFVVLDTFDVLSPRR